MPQSQKPRLRRVRTALFIIWTIIFAAYVLFFLAVGWIKDLDADDVRAAAWRSAYLLLPVLSAFAGFWFPGNRGQEKRADERIDWEAAFAAFVLTALVHGIVLLYFTFYVALYDFPHGANHNERFETRVDWGLNLLLFLSSLAVAPVAYVLRRPVSLGDPSEASKPRTQKARTRVRKRSKSPVERSLPEPADEVGVIEESDIHNLS